MNSFRYGPVGLYLVGFDGEGPNPATLTALKGLLDDGLVRLIDFVLVRKNRSGATEAVEVDDQPATLGLGTASLAAGLVGTDDIDELAEHIEPGASAVVIALEYTYERTLAEKLATSGGAVIRSERIPAPIVNAVLDLAEQKGED